MRFFYSEWNESAFAKLKNMKDLLSIFNYLLLQVNGDADLALKLMRKLQRMGVLPPNYDLDQFEQNLEKDKIVTFNDDLARLTSKGERSLRRDSFESIFNHLKNSGQGAHKLAFGGGSSEEILPEKRSFMFGDELRNIDFQSSHF